MADYVIWGTGARAKVNLRLFDKGICKNDRIVAFVDNNPAKCEVGFEGYPVVLPSKLSDLKYDLIDIWVGDAFRAEIENQLLELGVKKECIRSFFATFKDGLKQKYQNADDPEIEEVVEDILSQNNLSVFHFKPAVKHEMMEVLFDEDHQMKYVLFEGKRMYLKRGFNASIRKNGIEYVQDYWFEQDPSSPHLYESGQCVEKDGDVLVDVGTCEGNFSLHHIDKVSKVYMFECDEEWAEALQLTFAPYQDKVVICNKFVGDQDTDTATTIDSVVGEPIDFLKMDIEGAEISALHGAKRSIAQSLNLKCSICCYHRHDDEINIKEELTKNGMSVESSKGYMFFFHDDYALLNYELRRGIVRGVK